MPANPCGSCENTGSHAVGLGGAWESAFLISSPMQLMLVETNAWRARAWKTSWGLNELTYIQRLAQTRLAASRRKHLTRTITKLGENLEITWSNPPFFSRCGISKLRKVKISTSLQPKEKTIVFNCKNVQPRSMSGSYTELLIPHQEKSFNNKCCPTTIWPSWGESVKSPLTKCEHGPVGDVKGHIHVSGDCWTN